MAEHRRPAGQTFGEQLTEYLEATTRANGLRAGEWPQQTTEPPRMTVHKVEGYLPIPEEILMDEGIIPDTRPPRPRPRWRTRLRWRLASSRERLGLWAYWVITGDHIRTDDDEG